jgi:hypothetical protein
MLTRGSGIFFHVGVTRLRGFEGIVADVDKDSRPRPVLALSIFPDQLDERPARLHNAHRAGRAVDVPRDTDIAKVLIREFDRL